MLNFAGPSIIFASFSQTRQMITPLIKFPKT
jgi:hypothetical protein